MQMLIETLHQKFSDLGDLRMREIRVEKSQRIVYCTLSYPADKGLDNVVRSLITETIREQMPYGYNCSLKFVDDVFSKDSFARNLADLIKERYPVYSLSRNNISVVVEEKHIYATIRVSAVVKKNMELADFCATLTDHYADYTCYTVEFALEEDDNTKQPSVVGEQEKLVQLAINRELLKPSRYFDISGQNLLFGKKLANMPMYIADLRKPTDSCTVCGVVSAKSCRQSKNNPLLQVCSFSLTDNTGSTLSCVIFVRLQITDPETIMDEKGCGEAEARTLSEKRVLANDKKLKNILWLADGMSVAAHGKVVYGQNGQLEMHVYDLCVCKIAPIAADKEFDREVAEEYLLIKPEDCTEYRQINFVDRMSGRSVLSGKNYVVLHVNATGLTNVVDDKLYAICAVKLTDGHLSERLFTYVNPEKELISEKALEQCRISSDKLIFYPTLTEIISDLYKFTYGCTLVGNDLSQIVALLNYYAAPMNYKFTNETADQTDLLNQLSENSDMNAKVSKLDELAKKCKVSCPNTVFCLDTALTVARCMSILSDNGK